jgi:hypothetical protein
MDLLVIVAVVCAAWMTLALIVAALCRAASRVDAELDRLGAGVLRGELGQDRWRPAAL